MDAEDFVLTEGPETAGYLARPSSSADASGVSLEAVAECVGIPVEHLDYEPVDEAAGDEFVSEADDTLVAGSDAQVVLASQVATDREVLRHPRFAECYGAALERFFAGDNTTPYDNVDISVAAFEAVSPPAGATGAARALIKFARAGALLAAMAFDVVFIVEGRVSATLTFSNVGSDSGSGLGKPIPPDVFQAMVDQVAAKVARQ